MIDTSTGTGIGAGQGNLLRTYVYKTQVHTPYACPLMPQQHSSATPRRV